VFYSTADKVRWCFQVTYCKNNTESSASGDTSQTTNW